ncbi:hypothetical protein GTV32_22985 [Gordonia sp. SID5947]|uniref:DUF6545 domain-containing protein n=1 Tax=Gordonia sp. SID5947 TaxID=2690315 RepID=UPI00136F4BF8|nr:DUF6545 domain-containing protein [Gordonia sp. SID5947]MYR08999.1 hypothetical protein [Gordonia sp. SID5947]
MASSILEDQTVSTLPDIVKAPLLALGAFLVLYRILVIRDRRPTSTAANWYAFWIAVYALTREHALHKWIGDSRYLSMLSMSDVRNIGYAAFAASAMSLFLLAVRWRSRTGLASLRLSIVACTIVVGIGVALFVLASPARGLAVEELHSWRTGVYLTLYCVAFLPAEGIIAAILIGMARAATDWKRRTLVLLLLAAILVSAIDLATRIVSGWMLAAGEVNWFSEPRSAVLNDLLFYPSVIWLVPVGAPLVIQDIRMRLGFASSAEGRIQALSPMWNDLTTVAPQYRLAELSDSGLPSATEREHRMRIELEDIVFAMARYLPVNAQWPADPADRARMLHLACTRYSAKNTQPHPGGDTVQLPTWATDDGAVDAVAAAWMSVTDARPTALAASS